MNHFISITRSSVSETLYIYNALLPRTRTISIIPPAFDTESVTAGVGGLCRAEASGEGGFNADSLPIAGGAEPPVGLVVLTNIGHYQVFVGARGVLQHLQTVNAINNVNICQTHMYTIVAPMIIVKLSVDKNPPICLC